MRRNISTKEVAQHLNSMGLPESLTDGFSNISRAFLLLGHRALDGASWSSMLAYEQLEALALALRTAQQDCADLDDLFIAGSGDAEVDLLDQLDEIEATAAALSAA